MQELDHFKVEEESDGASGTVARLVTPDDNRVVEIPGSLLEKIYLLDNGCVLALLTDDAPYEETLYVLLFDKRYRILDRLEIYQAYAGGILSNVTIIGAYDLQFDFLDQTFQLSIKPTAEFQMSRAFAASPVHYPNRLQKTYLSVCYANKNQGRIP